MIQEEKELFIKDLCSRLPYGVKCSYFDINVQNTTYGVLEGFEEKEIFVIDDLGLYAEDVRPYLFPLSSMTEEQRNELNEIINNMVDDWFDNSNKWKVTCTAYSKCIDYLNSQHIDYRGLIEKGLAIDATNLGIYE